MRVKIVSGNQAGTIEDLEPVAAQSLLDTGYAVLAPEATEAAPAVLIEPEPESSTTPAASPTGDAGEIHV